MEKHSSNQVAKQLISMPCVLAEDLYTYQNILSPLSLATH